MLSLFAECKIGLVLKINANPTSLINQTLFYTRFIDLYFRYSRMSDLEFNVLVIHCGRATPEFKMVNKSMKKMSKQVEVSWWLYMVTSGSKYNLLTLRCWIYGAIEALCCGFCWFNQLVVSSVYFTPYLMVLSSKMLI